MGVTLWLCGGASLCGGFSGCRAQARGTQAAGAAAYGLSSCGLWALECRLSSNGTWAWLLCSMWNPPVPGINPVSSALAGIFLSTVNTREV